MGGSERILREIEKRCFFGQALPHYCERNRFVRCCGCCGSMLVLLLTTLWLLWIYLMFTTGGDALYNEELFAVVRNMIQNNSTFSDVCRFTDWTMLPGSVFVHQGAVLEVVNASGIAVNFLQLEYGHAGVYWQLSPHPRPDSRYGVVREYQPIPCHYKCGTVAASQASPKRLMWFFEKYRDQPYQVFRYNCLSFAEMIFQ